MVRNSLIHRALILALLCSGLAGAPAEARRPTPERLAALQQGRALWVKRDQLKSPERALKMVEDAADAGYTVLFLQVRGRGDAWYNSDLEPRADLLKDQREPDGTPWDPLAYTLRQAHARGLQVHAWFNSFLVWSNEDDPDEPRHVLNTHPEWVAVDGEGRSLADYSTAEITAARMEGVFLSPGIPAVRRHLTAVVHELAARSPEEQVAARLAILDTRFTPAWLAEHPRDQLIADVSARRGDEEPSADAARGLALQMEARSRHDVYDRLDRITAPTFVGSGRFDGIAPPANGEAMATGIPHAELHLYDGGHAFFFQDRAALPQVIEFLRS